MRKKIILDATLMIGRSNKQRWEDQVAEKYTLADLGTWRKGYDETKIKQAN